MLRAIGTLNRAQFLWRSLQIDECVKEAIYGVRAYTESGGYSGHFLSCYSTKIYGNGLFKKLEEAKKR